jgi:hypothetical protein
MSYSTTANSVILGNNQTIVPVDYLLTDFPGPGTVSFDIIDPISLQKGSWLLVGSINIQPLLDSNPITQTSISIIVNDVRVNRIQFESTTTSISIPVNVVLNINAGDVIRIKASATTVGNVGWYLIDESFVYSSFIRIA